MSSLKLTITLILDMNRVATEQWYCHMTGARLSPSNKRVMFSHTKNYTVSLRKKGVFELFSEVKG